MIVEHKDRLARFGTNYLIYNKTQARLQSLLQGKKPTSRRLQRLTAKRNNQIDCGSYVSFSGSENIGFISLQNGRSLDSVTSVAAIYFID